MRSPRLNRTALGGLLNLIGASAFLNIHPNTMRSLAMRGAIPCAKVGRCWRFIEEALLEWMRAQYSQDQRSQRDRSETLIDSAGAGAAIAAAPAPRAWAEAALDALLEKKASDGDPRTS